MKHWKTWATLFVTWALITVPHAVGQATGSDALFLASFVGLVLSGGILAGKFARQKRVVRGTPSDGGGDGPLPVSASSSGPDVVRPPILSPSAYPGPTLSVSFDADGSESAAVRGGVAFATAPRGGALNGRFQG